MRADDSEDYETAIEEWPGYLGHSWDGELFLGPELQRLSQFDWSAYEELEPGDERELLVHLGDGSKMLKLDAFLNVALLLDGLPSVEVTKDNGPPNAGPGSGGGYIFCLAENASLERLRADVGALIAALEADAKAFRA